MISYLAVSFSFKLKLLMLMNAAVKQSFLLINMKEMKLLILCIVLILVCSIKGQETDSIAEDKPKNWAGKWNSSNKRTQLGDWLLTGKSNPEGEMEERAVEYEGYDGWYNNMARPDSGAVDQPLLRRWPAAYEDSTYAPAGADRPNPLTLSETLLSGDTGTKSKTGKNALIVFFGQQVVEEILDAQRPACPPEYFNIDIPEGHKYRNTGHTQMPLLRTRYDQRTGYSPNNPRQQLNEITPYLDGGLFYGITKQWSDQLRTYENGTIDPDGCLASSHDGLFPAYNTQRLPMANPPPPFYHSMFIKSHETAKVSRFFKLGNPRGNENSFLLTFGIMWFRWHNYLAKRIRHFRPNATSEEVYNEARKWVIATQQQIVIYEWLPEWLLDNMDPYEKYDPSINPQIDQFFQTAAFRFGHTLVVPGVFLRDYKRYDCKTQFDTWGHKTVRTCNSFWRPYEPIVTKENNTLIDIDRLIMGMSVQLCEEEDHKIVEDLRGNVFGPLEFPRRDLMAINIQRARDHGIPDYNTVRQAYGLKNRTFENFTHLTDTVLSNFTNLYKNENHNIDLWIGGILETTDRPGELFSTIIKDQFKRIRDGDRFWFENTQNNLFTTVEIARIKQITIYDILMAVTKMDDDDIPRFPFNVAKDTDSDLIQTCSLTKSSCKKNMNSFNCSHLQPLISSVLNESCSDSGDYDYFMNSEASYILTFAALGTFIAGSIGVMFLLIQLKARESQQQRLKENQITRDTLKAEKKINYPLFSVIEWLGHKVPSRTVVVVLKDDKKVLEVISTNGDVLRALDMSITTKEVQVFQIKDAPYIIIKCTHDYDLVLKFESDYLRNNFINAFDPFLTNSGLKRENITSFSLSAALKTVQTKEDRQLLLEQFYRVVFAQAFKIQHSQKELLHVDESLEKEIVNTELTVTEFAEAMSMRPKDEFVKRIFSLVDKDKNGFISFREFVDLLIIFANGTEEQKARLLFDMYDVNAVEYLTEENFIAMIKSFLATVEGKVEDEKLQATIKGMIQRAGLGDKKQLDFDDFLKLFGKDIKNLSKAKLNFKGVKSKDRHSYLEEARDVIENIYESRQEIQERFQGEIRPPERDTSKIIDDNQAESLKTAHRTRQSRVAFIRYIELKSKEIFWLSLYTLVLWAIFIERAYYYTVEREHSGLRRIAGYGVTITRGAASAMMFTYSSLVVTMCRNTITYLRDTVANKYFPFDASVQIHKYIAAWAFIFTVIHIIGHAFNFYHISTQTADDLTCLFRNFFHATHELPKFHYWCWQTMTGFTGILLTLVWTLMYVFAQNIVRSKIYNWFWYTHSLYPLFFILMILHGTGRLIQPPIFYYFFMGPIILFTIDSLISISRKKIEIPVLRAEILPSNVTMLEFRKPENFQYKSGQWVRIACLTLNKNEYHPFTLSSSPDEENLTVHIRAVGPWTTNLRMIYDSNNKARTLLPKLYLDGPFGEGHQDWNLYDTSILIGGGIGVTPFASILKDVIFKSNQTRCQKVYFIWVSRNQKQFEWLVDLIRELEYKDRRNVISCHIFITQFFEKFDLRTIFLYICERHYQRISNRSLFTNLKAVTHFGHPNFEQFFATVSSLHNKNDDNENSIGVFSCGPPSMTASVDAACNKLNGSIAQRFEHHFKNF